MLIVIAANAPSFFPEWWQSAVYGFGLGAGLFGGAYAYHFTLIRDDLKRKDEKITELEKKLERSRSVKAEEFTAEDSQSSNKRESNGNVSASLISNLQLKDETLKVVHLIRQIALEAKSQTGPLNTEIRQLKNRLLEDYASNPSRQNFHRLKSKIDTLEAEEMSIEAKAISTYSKDINDRPRQLRDELIKCLSQTPEGILQGENYADINDIQGLEQIANDLTTLVHCLPEN